MGRTNWESRGYEDGWHAAAEMSGPVVHEKDVLWFNSSGMSMEPVSRGYRKRFVELSSSVARVVIKPTTSGNWLVKWRVVHNGPENVSNGRRLFSDADLIAAFGLDGPEYGGNSKWMVDQYCGGFGVAKAGSFVRYRQKLNIPCPGTGRDGDPNVSICVDDVIKNAISQLMTWATDT